LPLLALDRLRAAERVIEALRTAAALAKVFRDWPALERWVDWPVASADAQAVLLPYRDALRAALVDYAEGRSDAAERWPRVEQRYAPVVALLWEVGRYAEACAGLPSGVEGEAAKLLTPLHGAPFAL